MAHMRELLRENRSDSQLALLRLLMAGPGNQTQLAKRSGLSTGTVSTTVGELERAGHVRKDQTGKENLIQLRPTEGVAVGIELGYQHTVVLARLAHEHRRDVRRKESRGIGVATTPQWVDEVKGLVEDAVESTGEPLSELTTVGLAVPRIVDPRTGRLAEPVLPPWQKGQNPAAELGRRLAESFDTELSVRLDNDASLGALAESVYAHSEAETLLYVKCSTGVGSGIVISGKVFRGASGAAGEIGHMRMRDEGVYCLCGGRGCLETLAGGDALIDAATASLGHRKHDPPRTLDQLVRKADEGDALCVRVVRDALQEVGRAIGIVCNVLNPDVVVLGGKLAQVRNHLDVVAECRTGIAQSAVSAALVPRFKVQRPAMSDPAAHGALLMGVNGTLFRPDGTVVRPGEV